MRSLVRRYLMRVAARHRAEATTHADIAGFPVTVLNMRDDIKTEDVLARLREALELVELHHPRAMRRLRKDCTEFWVHRFPCRGAFYEDHRACLTELTFLARRDIPAVEIASSIVHEGMHARIKAMGVRPESRDRVREERICRRAELAFAERLPEELREPVRARAWALESPDTEDVAPTIDWEEARLNQGLADIDALSIPRWVRHALQAWLRRRHRRRAA